MADNNKAVGALAAAKLVTLIKAETGKKYDKTGGKIEGSAEITGGLKVGMSSEFSSSIKAGSEISSDMLLMAPIVTLHDPETEESISFGVSGENAAKVTSTVSGGGTQYARLAVGTPTGDNDAATKAYVDGLTAAGYEVITVTSTDVSDLGYDASEGANRYSVTFDASFDSILANLAANKPMKFNITLPDSTGGFPVSFSTGYVSAINDSGYLFTGTILKYPVVLSIGAPGSATVYLYGAYLPEPNPDNSDDGKVLSVNNHKWEIKAIPVGSVTVDAALSSTSTNPVQNKAVKTAIDAKADKSALNSKADKSALDAKADKTALDGKLSTSGGTLTGNLTGKYITGTWLQTTEAADLGRVPGKIAVLDDSGWVYYRTPSEILNDIGGASKEYVDDHATGGATKVTISGTIEGEVSGYTSATYQQIVNEIAKNCNIWLTIDGETIRLSSWKRSGASDYKLVFFGSGSGALTVKYEVTASASSATMTVTGG